LQAQKPETRKRPNITSTHFRLASAARTVASIAPAATTDERSCDFCVPYSARRLASSASLALMARADWMRTPAEDEDEDDEDEDEPALPFAESPPPTPPAAVAAAVAASSASSALSAGACTAYTSEPSRGPSASGSTKSAAANSASGSRCSTSQR
jgi:hypothetical protein